MQNVLLSKPVKWVVTYVLGKYYCEVGTVWNAMGRNISDEGLMTLICLTTAAVSMIIFFA